MDLSIVIPAYLEEENLRVLLPRLIASVDELNIAYEVLVVDGVNSKDKTCDVCKEFGVRYMVQEGGNHYGDAVRTGIRKVTGEYLLFMDADGSHEPEFINKVYEARNGYDIVIASRYVAGGGTNNKGASIIMSWAVNFTYSFLFSLHCKDVSNSFKLYRRSLFGPITLKSDHFDVIQEILIKMKRTKKDLSIHEIPYHLQERMYGDTKRNLFVFAVSYIQTLVRLKFMD